MKYKDYYATLGVSRDADLEAIKKAYRKLARQHHPDVSKDSGAEARFKEAAEAYATLKNPETRAAYDALGQQRAGAEFSPPPHWQDGPDVDPSAYDSQDLADLLDALARRSGTARGQSVPVPGRSYEDTVHIGLAQAHRGTTLHLNLADTQGDKTLEVTIPAGVTAGQKLRLRGKGGKGRNGGADGDFFLHIQVNPDPVFRLDGRDLYFVLALAPWEAALGTAVEVPTLDGPVVLTVPPGSSSGRKLRLRSRGLANSRGEPGDLYATVRIDVPTNLSEPQRKLYQELEQLAGFNPRGNSAKESTHV